MDILRRASLSSDDCEYRPHYEADSDYSDDSSGLAGARRRRKNASLGIRKGGGGGAGGTRVLHRWTAEEHARLEALVRQYGTERNWALIAEGVRGRSGKQCRERWLNHMREGIIKGNWLADEEFHLALCHTLVGNQWSQHCSRLRGRTENSIKNYWNATLRSKQANKRRGFLWSYIDRVRGALDDEDVRYRAFADTVRTVYAQNNDWLPSWLRGRIDGGELEVPRPAEALGRGWRRLFDRELAFLKERDGDVTLTGIPFPNPASRGEGPLPTLADAGPAADGLGMQQQGDAAAARAAARAEQQRLVAAPAAEAWDGLILQPQQPAAAAAMACMPLLSEQQHDQPQQHDHHHQQQRQQQRPSICLDLIDSGDLEDVMMRCDPGLAAACGAGATTAAAAAAAAGPGGACDDTLLVEPRGGMPLGQPQAHAWWSQLAAAAAPVLNHADSESLSRDSSFCGSVGPSVPALARLRLHSNSPACIATYGSVPDFSTAAAAAAAAAPYASAAAVALGVAGGGANYTAVNHLATAPSFASDVSAASTLQQQLGGMRPGLQGRVPDLSQLHLLLQPQQQQQQLLQQQQQHQQQQQATQQPQSLPATPDARAQGALASPFGSPHVQSGGAFDGWCAGLPPARSAGSAPPALGIPLASASQQQPQQPTLSRFAAAVGRRAYVPAADAAQLQEQQQPQQQQGDGFSGIPSFGAPGGHGSQQQVQIEAMEVQQQQQQQHVKIEPCDEHMQQHMETCEAATPPTAALMRQSAAGGEGQQRLESTDAEAAADPARASCCGSVGSGGAAPEAAAGGSASNSGGAAAGGGAVRTLSTEPSGSLGLLSYGSLGVLGLRGASPLLIDGAAMFPDLPTPKGAAPAGAASAGAAPLHGASRRVSSLGLGDVEHLLGAAKSADLAAILGGLVGADSMQAGLLEAVLGTDS